MRGVYFFKSIWGKKLSRLKSDQKERFVRYKKLLISRDKKAKKRFFAENYAMFYKDSNQLDTYLINGVKIYRTLAAKSLIKDV